MMRFIALLLFSSVSLTGAHAAANLKMDDKASVWPRASADQKIDFTNRMGKAMISLSPNLDNRYFMKCLEETANIGNTKELTLNDMVRTCISLGAGKSDDEN